MSHYKPYPAYKDSGIEWIGQVPEKWKVVSLLHLFNIKAGGDLKKEFYSEEKTEEYPYPIYTNSIKSNEAYGFTSKPFFKANTITVTGRGEIGYAIYRDHEYDAIIRLLVLTPKNNKPCKYFAYCINSILVFFGGNTAVSQLSTEQISPYKIFCPPFLEQQAIVSFLDRQTARIDALITKKTRFIELLKEKRQAFITHAVTKGLNPNVKMKDSGVEWIGEVPEHWSIVPLKIIAEIVNGATPDSKNTAYWDGDIAWYTPADIDNTVIKPLSIPQRQITEAGLASCSARLTPAGSIVISTRAPVGSIGVTTTISTTNQGCRSITPVPGMPSMLLASILAAARSELAQRSNGTTFQELSAESLRALRIPLPPIDERLSISSALDRQTARIDHIIEKTQRSIDLLRERRSALITAAVTGKIDLRGSL